MGFRNGAYAKCWSVEAVSDKVTKVRLSVSKKNRATGEYEQDFSGFVRFVGADNAQKAKNLNEGDKIKLGDVDVTSHWDKEKKKEYVDYICFSYEMDSDAAAKKASSYSDPDPMEDGDDGSGLPF